MSSSFHFDIVDIFTTGTVGPKGQRVFFVQAHAEGQVVSLRLEKQQVAALGVYIEELLGDLPPISVDDFTTAGDLVEPILAEWVIGSLGVAYDEAGDRLVLIAEELADDEVEPATARFAISRAQAVAFSAQASASVEAGRDPCQFCERPLDPGGTWCPCHN